MEKKKVLILIEDELDIAEALKFYFEKKSFEIHNFRSSEDFFNSGLGYDIGTFLVDWNLPGESGIELIRKIRQKDKLSPIIMVSAFSQKHEILEGLKSGADDYVTKPFHFDELYQRVLNAHSKYELVLSRVNDDHFKLLPEANAFIKDGNTFSLTPREFTIFSYLYTNQEKPVDREILVSLFGDDDKVTSRNIDVHIFSLRKKIKESNLGIQTIWGKGYQLVE